MRKSTAVLLAALTLSVPACSMFKKKAPPPPDLPDHVVIGSVEMVNKPQNFVLVHNPERRPWQPGIIMTAAADAGETAKLKVSPERQGSYFTADIVSGTPQKGNAVIWHRKDAPTAAQDATPSASIRVPGAEPPPPAAPPPVPTASLSPNSP